MRSSVASDVHEGRRRSGSGEHGQATVELALATPVLCLLLLGIVQLAVVVRDQLTVIEAARVGARAAAAAADSGGAAAAVVDISPSLHPQVSTAVEGSYVTVTVTAISSTDVPLIGALLPDVEVSGRATMLLEPP
jgi:Flp pilus assembly protein TadG